MPNMEQLMAASKKDGVGGALGTNGEIAGHGLDESVVATGHERTADPQVGQRGIGEFYRRARVAVELCNGVGKTTVLEYHLAIAPATDAVGVGRTDIVGGQRRRSDELLAGGDEQFARSEEHTSELQSLMRSSYAVFCLKKKK